MNPFELRYSVFQSAKDFLEQQYKASMQTFDLLDAASKAAAAEVPKFPTVDEVIEKAIQINRFVSDTTPVDSISKLYESVLGRAPDAEGLAFWEKALVSGQSLKSIKTAFKESPEKKASKV